MAETETLTVFTDESLFGITIQIIPLLTVSIQMGAVLVEPIVWLPRGPIDEVRL